MEEDTIYEDLPYHIRIIIIIIKKYITMNKIILVLMIKNEEAIIERCLSSIVGLVDGICITDTGSTDRTVSIVHEYFKTVEIPSRLYQNKWKNFGHNRTRSFLNTLDFTNKLDWDLSHTYGLLLDADMKLVIGKFNKDSLHHAGYKMIQTTSTMDYYNTRLVRMNYPWKCMGVTHEYWDGESDTKLSKDQLYIQDVGDGGSKSDKFERDIRLLESGILEDPTNCRYYFYLAQSYKDHGDTEKAIQYYKKRIKLGGWFEEVWYSHYMISLCYLKLKNEIKFEQWALSAYQYHKHRAEPIYQLVKYFRETSQYYKAYHYYLIGKEIPYPMENLLFVEKNIYEYMFEWENSVLQYYIFPKERIDGMKQLVRYFNRHEYGEETAYSNTKHYITRLDCEIRPLELVIPDEYVEFTKDFIPSSVSLIKVDDKILANIRYVDYTYDPKFGRYAWKNEKYVTTKNAFLFFNDKFESITRMEFMNNPLDISSNDVSMVGLEDIRLYLNKDEDKMYYTASTQEYSYNDKIRVLQGEYNYHEKKYINNICMIPPEETEREKNWIRIGDQYIYQWYPLQIGSMKENQLKITFTQDTPKFFKYCRGSTHALEYNNQYWIVTHGYIHDKSILNEDTRLYYHQIIILDKNYHLVRYTIPFYFKLLGVEYCIGFMIIGDYAYFTPSVNDSNPILVKIAMNKLEPYFI